MRSPIALLVPAVAAAAAAVTFGAAPAAASPAPSAAPGSFVAVPAFRALDTRRSGAPVRAGHRVTVPIAGRGRVPAGASAVAVTVHAIAPRGNGTLTAFPANTAAPHTATLSYRRAVTVAQAALVRLSGGAITILDRAAAGTVRLAVDVSGYYVGGRVSGTAPGLVHVLPAPSRALDTRTTGGAVRAQSVRTFRVGHGVPAHGVGAVAVALTAVDPARGGALIAYAAGNDQPATPSVPFAAGHVTTGFAWVPTHSDGSISIANTSTRKVTVLVDVAGWANAGVAQVEGALQPRFPARITDNATVAAHGLRTVAVAGRGGVPLAHLRAVLATVTAAGATRGGSLIVWPGGSQPRVSSVDFAARRTSASLVEVPLSPRGTVSVRNTSNGPVRLSVDVTGFVPAVSVTPPPVSISRYLGDLTENLASDQTVMAAHGCADAHAMPRGPRFVLLDVGAQSITAPLSAANPGVAVTQTVDNLHLSYLDLRSVLQPYLHAFSTCSGGKPVTIAIGTNNDGAWDPSDATHYYAPDLRGRDWAGSVVNMLGSETGVTIIGADDIEPDFASTQHQALQWEHNFLSVVNQPTDAPKLVFNGSADGCPDGFGATDQGCSSGWTQRGLYRLAHSGADIAAVPQVYGPSMAAEWANIDRTGGGGIAFAGALTEHALAPTTYSAANAWTALYYALGTRTRVPSVPAASDITDR